MLRFILSTASAFFRPSLTNWFTLRLCSITRGLLSGHLSLHFLSIASTCEKVKIPCLDCPKNPTFAPSMMMSKGPFLFT